jgi:hypothetical protein
MILKGNAKEAGLNQLNRELDYIFSKGVTDRNFLFVHC